MTDFKIAYFGGEPLGVPVLEELQACGIIPNLIVCNPDRPSGRKLILTPPPVKAWADKHFIPTFQPGSFDDQATLGELTDTDWDLFVVVAYNHILPKWLIELPKHKTLNVHPSLLPKLRGPSPIRTAILEDERESIGVTVMLMDIEMDHGPIVAQKSMPIADEHWPIAGCELDEALARMGGALLADSIPKWINGEIEAAEQDHKVATYTKKMTKADGEILLDPFALPEGDEARILLRKIRAFDGFPGTFFIHSGKRVKITEAKLAEGGSLHLLRVTPEGKSEMDFNAYLNTLQNQKNMVVLKSLWNNP